MKAAEPGSRDQDPGLSLSDHAHRTQETVSKLTPVLLVSTSCGPHTVPPPDGLVQPFPMLERDRAGTPSVPSWPHSDAIQPTESRRWELHPRDLVIVYGRHS